ncbi:MAG: hypothetical protein ACREBD_04135 [Blastocatellia bacterium]
MEHEHERKVDAVIAYVATGGLTFDGLKGAVAKGREQVMRLGSRIEPTTLKALAAGEDALERIEREQSKLAQMDL